MGEDVLTWISHPLKKNKRNTLLVILFLVLAPAIVFFSTRSLFFLLLSFLILLGSLSSFFLPTSYELSQERIRVKFFFNTKEMEWKKYRSFYVDKNGVLLSPFEKPSRLENFRGIYIRFNQNKEEVVNFLKERIKS
ncbi:MAG: hypothetical protein MUO78_01435 [candidate division Zixibacteria bacterium]|nr:hypothetical protein [candidate division Zixibacteria bacterium]